MQKRANKLFALFTVVLSLSAFAAAGETDAPAQDTLVQAETVTRHLMNGLFSIAIPETWHIEVDERGRGVVLSEFPGSLSTVAISAANPVVDVDGLASYAELVAKAALDAFENGEIIGTNDNPFKGNPARAVVFKAEASDGPVVGLVGAMYFDGFAVAMLVCGPQKDFDDFIRPAGMALETFELNHELALQKQSELADIGQAIINDLSEVAE